ncbi:hypothetical protein BCON_0063g00360 [Botryotinia convoluta]|uniref:Single-strand DNA deaminase toxin A-like C-terminal domain-containing protein n=1 Tax=Botryotinia convoluta TaxID=54673 RepID=A0A4Z1I7V0_9HELO|nr:hypothetical protein BCON_0063g00360 [Botryotinia convoluta]
MARKNGSNMPQADLAVPPKQKSRRGQNLEATRSRRTGNKSKKGLKMIKTIPMEQGPVMRLADGSFQAAVEKGRPEIIAGIDIKVAELIENLDSQEEVTEAAVESLGEKDQSSKQEVECVPRVEEENATEIAGTLTEVGTQTELDSFDLATNMFKQMIERSELNQERRHRENEENQERRYQELYAIIAKWRDADPKVSGSTSPEDDTSESLSRSLEKSEEVEYHAPGADVDYSVAHTPNVLADSVDHSLNKFADSVDFLIYSLERTSLQNSQDINEFKYINPDHSRWFRYHQNSTDQHVELCQLVPQVVQSYPIPREKTAIARLNINGLHRCTAASGWDQPFQKNDIISNLTWTSQVEELCKVINHKLPHRKDLDNGFPGRYHACHAEKQLIAWYLYENTFAGYQVNMKLPNTLPYREIKASAPRGALIVVSRKICKDCKEFIEKVKKHFGISDHIHVESRTHPEDIFDTEKTKKSSDQMATTNNPRQQILESERPKKPHELRKEAALKKPRKVQEDAKSRQSQAEPNNILVVQEQNPNEADGSLDKDGPATHCYENNGFKIANGSENTTNDICDVTERFLKVKLGPREKTPGEIWNELTNEPENSKNPRLARYPSLDVIPDPSWFESILSKVNGMLEKTADGGQSRGGDENLAIERRDDIIKILMQGALELGSGLLDSPEIAGKLAAQPDIQNKDLRNAVTSTGTATDNLIEKNPIFASTLCENCSDAPAPHQAVKVLEEPTQKSRERSIWFEYHSKKPQSLYYTIGLYERVHTLHLEKFSVYLSEKTVARLYVPMKSPPPTRRPPNFVASEVQIINAISGWVPVSLATRCPNPFIPNKTRTEKFRNCARSQDIN